MQQPASVKVAGIHLAGPNSTKTTLVIMTGRLGEGNLKITAVFDRLGTVNRLFSDDRLFELLRAERPDRVMIDSPLTVPPCVACTRPMCPGVDACEDIAVAYMQKLVEQKGKRRRKPMNPQTQRIWDVQEWLNWHPTLQEPSYSANKAPLVARAVTLQRRLNSLEPPLKLFETSVPHILALLVDQLSLPSELAYEYRAYGVGGKRRKDLLDALVRTGYLDQQDFTLASGSVETYHAVLAAFLAGLEQNGQVTRPDNPFFAEQGWVYLPRLGEGQGTQPQLGR